MASPASKKIPHADFAQRMHLACDGNGDVPKPNFGRLGWFVDEFDEKFDYALTAETVRKWFAGEARPRPRTMSMLAQILEVDEAWLSVGSDPAIPEKQRRLRDATVDGVVNVVAGCIQMDGGHPAFPDDDDAASKNGLVDLTAIIKGALYSFHVVLAEESEDGWTFAIPSGALDLFVLGVVRLSSSNFRFFEFDRDRIEELGTRRSGHVSISVPFDAKASPWREIGSFSERI